MPTGPEHAAPEAAAESERTRAVGGPAQAPASGSALQARALALQRTVGNRAVAALAHRGRAPQALLQRRRASPRPAPNPNPSWATKGLDNPEHDCKPFPPYKDYHDAKLTWDLYAAIVPDKLTERCHCDLVGEAYAKYLEAQRTSYAYPDTDNCISRQLAQDDITHDTDAMTKRSDPRAIGIEQVLIDRWRRREAGILWYSLTGATRSMEIDYVEATQGSIQPADRGQLTETEISNDLTYVRNDLAGGLLFGSGTADHVTPDSEFGFDTRHVSGTIKITRTDDGSNPNFMDVDEVFTFYYRVHDALDFCPGNTLRKDDWDVDSIAYNTVLSDLSRLEATGMARDVEFTVNYHTTKTVKGWTVGRPRQ
ncbi:hypothetical protein FSW04_04730 [Baekduia soli]|uniref:Uncharacterized protein n=1 Tax=Baekduia soli TaxID=496014 RepID=A0A5B8U1Z5_9ACTN|nr:hypothetical protein [Baekduia soli]QEC46962.1 hypothetical protein FSW04_04730 [Baekduia soli]